MANLNAGSFEITLNEEVIFEMFINDNTFETHKRNELKAIKLITLNIKNIKNC
jgi:hypothetical protein